MRARRTGIPLCSPYSSSPTYSFTQHSERFFSLSATSSSAISSFSSSPRAHPVPRPTACLLASPRPSISYSHHQSHTPKTGIRAVPEVASEALLLSGARLPRPRGTRASSRPSPTRPRSPRTTRPSRLRVRRPPSPPPLLRHGGSHPFGSSTLSLSTLPPAAPRSLSSAPSSSARSTASSRSQQASCQAPSRARRSSDLSSLALPFISRSTLSYLRPPSSATSAVAPGRPLVGSACAGRASSLRSLAEARLPLSRHYVI